jgi:hypothetical protein
MGETKGGIDDVSTLQGLDGGRSILRSSGQKWAKYSGVALYYLRRGNGHDHREQSLWTVSDE